MSRVKLIFIDGFDWLKILCFEPYPMEPTTDEPIVDEPTDEPTDEPINEPTDVPTSGAVQDQYKCLAEMVVYPCCKEGNTHVYDHDANGDWGYDIDDEEWCGITPYDGRIDDEVCWS